jgi:hypothetical protein
MGVSAHLRQFFAEGSAVHAGTHYVRVAVVPHGFESTGDWVFLLDYSLQRITVSFF